MWGTSPMLTDRAIRTTKPAATPRKLWDQGGLYLLCTPNGSRLWRLKYRVGHGAGRREKLLALGGRGEGDPDSRG